MKKLLSILLSVLLLVSVCTVVVFAEDEPELQVSANVSKTEVSRGDVIDFTINLDKNVGLTTMALLIDYDANVLEFVCPTHEEGWCEAVTKASLASGNAYGGDNAAMSPTCDVNPFLVQWAYGTTKKAVEYTGTIVTASFKVKDAAAFGKSDINVTLDESNCNKFVSYSLAGRVDEPFTTVKAISTSVTVICPHANTTNVPEEKSTCQSFGHAAYTKCNDCNEVISGSDAPYTTLGDHVYTAGVYGADENNHWQVCTVCSQDSEHKSHTGGTATCTAQAKCTVCSKSYGSLKDHNYSVVDKDADNHWNKCKDCSAIDSTTVKTHSYVLENQIKAAEKSPASCKDDAVYYKSCACGWVSTSAGDTFVAANTATGNHVDADGKWETNDTQHWHTCGCGEEFDKSVHTGGTATCTKQAECSVCKKAYGDLKAHQYTVAKNDADYHWNKCANCDATDTKVAHTFDQTTVKNATTLKDAATCVEDAVYYKTCACGWVSTTETHVDVDSHKTVAHTYDEYSHDAENHWQVCTVTGCGNETEHKAHEGGEATCIALAKCDVCSTEYGELDPDNHKDKSRIEWTVTEEPTTEKEGKRNGICPDCNQPVEEDMPKLTAALTPAPETTGGIEISITVGTGDEPFTGYTEVSLNKFEELPTEKIDNKVAIDGFSIFVIDTDKGEFVAKDKVTITLKIDTALLSRYQNLAVAVGEDVISVTPDENGYITFDAATADLETVYLVGEEIVIDNGDEDDDVISGGSSDINTGSDEDTDDTIADDTTADDTTTDDEDDSTSPKTGDTAAVAFAVVLTAIASSVLVLFKKRTRA